MKCKKVYYLMLEGNFDLSVSLGFFCGYCIKLRGKVGEK